MNKVKTTPGSENFVNVQIPADVLESYGISVGDEIDLTKADNALVLRSLKEAEKSREIADATEKVFDRWNDVFVELAKGADEK